MRIIDLSPRVEAGSPVWPGDTPFALEANWSISDGASVNVGTVRSTTHVGAHIDAPSHVVEGAGSIEHTDLDACVGLALVIDVSDLVDRSSSPHGQPPIARVTERVSALAGSAPVERLLLRHYVAGNEAWDEELPGVSPALMRWFASQGGRLMGVDIASFDPAQSKTLDCHRVGIEASVVLLEGLDLRAAPEGEAELIALPLPWVGADASPVRAVLRVT